MSPPPNCASPSRPLRYANKTLWEQFSLEATFFFDGFKFIFSLKRTLQSYKVSQIYPKKEIENGFLMEVGLVSVSEAVPPRRRHWRADALCLDQDKESLQLMKSQIAGTSR